MRRCTAWIGLVLLLLVAGAATAPQASADTTTAELRAKLRNSRRALRESRARLIKVREELASARQILATYGVDALDETVVDDPAAPDSSPDSSSSETADAVAGEAAEAATIVEEVDGVTLVIVPTLAQVEALEDRVVKVRKAVRRWKKRVEELATRVRRRERIAEWNRQGKWRPLIEIAARRNGINAAALYRMMLYESSGRRYAGTTYKGLFQYLPSTWAATWNPHRGASIYNGWAQIRATAYAIKRGYGPRMWPSTYPRAF